jgi:hypothetical protein
MKLCQLKCPTLFFNQTSSSKRSVIADI